MAPAGAPAAAINRLNSELQKILAGADILKKFETQGAEAVYKGPAEFGRFIRAETAKWGKVVRDAGIKAE